MATPYHFAKIKFKIYFANNHTQIKRYYWVIGFTVTLISKLWNIGIANPERSSLPRLNNNVFIISIGKSEYIIAGFAITNAKYFKWCLVIFKRNLVINNRPGG